MTLRSPQPLPSQFRRKVGPLTRRIVEQRHRGLWQYRLERWGRVWSRWIAKLREGKRYMWMIGGGVLTMVVVGIIGVIFFSSAFQVKEIRVRRTDLRMDMRLIEQALNPLFGRHMLFVRESDIKTVLKDTISDIHQVILTKEYPARMIVDLTLEPLIVRLVLSGVDGEPSTATGTGDILDFVTTDGRYMRYRDAHVPRWSQLPVISLVDWGIKPQPGQFLLEPKLLGRIFEAEDILRERFGQNVRKRTVFVRGREFHIAVDKYELWFDEQSPLSDQLGRYTLFLKTVGGEIPLKYIDLRLRDRVVYH